MIKTEDTTEEMSEKVKPKIINEPEKAVSDMGDKVSDSWITAKVKTTLIYSKNISSYNISVDTKDGKVTLSGQVSNAAERDLAIELAQNIRGVQSVQANDLNF